MAGVREVLAERYELLEVLGRGGMGVVYRARDRVLGRVVAVKVLPFDRAQDPVSVARFEREALAVAALSHRNIVAVFDAGSDGDTRFIVMEYLGGRTLAEVLRERGALDVEQAVDVAAQVASALAAAHRAGIVHRDIKPANVMLDEHGHIKVLDFGIARLVSGLSLTQTAMVIGSAQYLAPELCRGASADARSDIYALGCVLYAL
ncbi:MAG TPA: protein kinase, partial [Solirubrobacteraceae bacterium]|nr:protein kinase [Solirubrobacteraceae bacterium]